MFNIYKSDFNDYENYIIATYYIKTNKTLEWAAWQLAIGQSVGNPNVRNRWENDELFNKHSCLILSDITELQNKTEGLVNIAFPIVNINFDTDGISQLLCMLMGGQTDINGIISCGLLDIDIPQKIIDNFNKPKFGIDGFRKYTKQYNKPFLGGIIKPKTGISPYTLSEMVKEMVDGGVDFIKEDEIMSNPSCCPLEKRLKVIVPIIQKTNIAYCYCINGDPYQVLKNYDNVFNYGGNGVHINFWSGLGIYRNLRDKDYPIFIHCQTSGNKILTSKSNIFYIDHGVFTLLCALSGIDFFHAGMIGGYGGYDETETLTSLNILRKYNVIPALSCGMHPGLVEKIRLQIGNDWMANCGGAIHGHPNGTVSGAKAMRQSIDKNYQQEFYQAIQKWGSN